MSFAVRILGPEFQSEESRKVFLRIEESVQQYSAHSRESVSLVRNPFALAEDHFVILWSHGGAVVELIPFGGRISGGKFEDWIAEQSQGHAIAEEQFANPYIEAMDARRELIRVVEGVGERAVIKPEIQPVAIPSQETGAGRSAVAERVSENVAVDRKHWLKAIVLFTLPVRELAIDDSLKDSNFSAMSIEYAVSRTVYHLPNLLRLTDQQRGILSSPEIDAICSALESESLGQSSARGRAAASGVIPPLLKQPLLRRKLEARSRSRFRWWWVPSILIPLFILFFILRPATPTSTTGDDTLLSDTGVKRHPNTDLVLVLPQEVQLFISPQVYKTRIELDQALAHGEGERILPSSQNLVITLDSAGFARGVYGYFKVDNAWRKGKLLQAFHTNDTIKIDNFLPPLP